MDRTSLIRGPAVLKLVNPATPEVFTILYTEEDIAVTAEITSSEGKNAVHGNYDEFLDTVVHTISFKPAPQAKAEYFAVLFPYQAFTLGASIYGDTPSDLIVWSVDGTQYTYKVAALTTMPNLSLAANTPIYDGEAVFTAIGDCTEDWSTADHFVADASVPFTDASFDQALDIRAPYNVGWGNPTIWADIQTESGIKVSFDLQLGDVLSDSSGIIDKVITGCTATASFTPLNVTPEQVLAALDIQGGTRARGSSMTTARLGQFTAWISNSVEFSIPDTILSGGASQFGATANRVGEISVKSIRSITAGLSRAVFAIGAG